MSTRPNTLGHPRHDTGGWEAEIAGVSSGGRRIPVVRVPAQPW